MKKTKKSLKLSNKKLKIVMLATGIIILLMFAVQAVLFMDLYKRTNNLETGTIKALVVDSVRNLENQPVVDPATGKEYVPAMRLVLPPKDEITLVYDGDKEEVLFGERSNINHAAALVLSAEDIEKTFEHVSNLQACSKQIVLKFASGNTEELKLIHTKKLLDGRTVYMYENEQCQGDSSMLIEYLKQVESY